MNMFGGLTADGQRLAYFLSCIPPGVWPVSETMAKELSTLTETVYHVRCDKCGCVTASHGYYANQCYFCHRPIRRLPPLEG